MDIEHVARLCGEFERRVQRVRGYKMGALQISFGALSEGDVFDFGVTAFLDPPFDYSTREEAALVAEKQFTDALHLQAEHYCPSLKSLVDFLKHGTGDDFVFEDEDAGE